MTAFNRSFNVMLSDQHFQDLSLLALAAGVSKGQIIRHLIRDLARMRLHRVPTCVTGRDCFMPHLHTFPVDTPSIPRIPQSGGPPETTIEQ